MPRFRPAAAVIIAAALLLMLPDHAWAFGPATHVLLGSTMLDMLHLLPPDLAQLLRAHPQSYLYGNMAADISL